MERIQFQQRYLGVSQEFNRMSEGILTISGIPKSANNLGENSDIGGIIDQSTIEIESSFIFEKEYINSISNFNISILTVSSTFIFFSFSISERLY